jgi:anti-sigma factor RsiW
VKLMGGGDLHVLTGSYALDALAEPERKSFERHLVHCAACQAEVCGLRETAARLTAADQVAGQGRPR